MKISSPKAGYILSVVYLLGSLATIYFLVNKQLEYSKRKTHYTETLTFENRVLNVDEWLSDKDDLQPKLQAAAEQNRRALAEMDQALLHGWLIAGYSFLLLLLLIIMYMKSKALWRVLTVGMLCISMACLVAGVLAPMLEIAFVKSDLHVEGTVLFMDIKFTFWDKMFFFFQNKSIMQVVGVLFSNGNAFVAIIIMTASIIIPLIKIVASTMVLFAPKFNKAGIINFIDKIGKWSMIDVFVVSVFLSVLAVNNMNTGVEAESQALPGLYFFGAYVILSMVAFILLKVTLKKEGTWPKYKQFDEIIADKIVGDTTLHELDNPE